ncbi:MAG: carboxypeptidase regulatory-like domain-containing protein [Deltaproteobacteria bacterium]|nr:carboxypeptidase regulatory-like domain-containing protein [Deltaproteobacteria bacterium]
MTKPIQGAVALLIAVAACRHETERRPPTPLDHTTVGVIAGEVRFAGTPPAPRVEMSSAKECGAQHGGAIDAGDVLVRDDRVQNAIVAIEDGLGDRVFAVPETPVVVDQRGCLFVPRVAAAQVDQPIEFLNSDALAHNVHGTPAKSSAWNFSLGLKGATRVLAVDAAQPVIPITCDIHPWMQAYLGVYDHPYFMVTGANGQFTLRDVPPGTYVVEAWHERFGTRTATVTLAPKETTTVTFTFGGG